MGPLTPPPPPPILLFLHPSTRPSIHPSCPSPSPPRPEGRCRSPLIGFLLCDSAPSWGAERSSSSSITVRAAAGGGGADGNQSFPFIFVLGDKNLVFFVDTPAAVVYSSTDFLCSFPPGLSFLPHFHSGLLVTKEQHKSQLSVSSICPHYSYFLLPIFPSL